MSRSFTSSSVQKNCCASCTHSKYETVTPPAFARMSGTTKTPRSRRIASASSVVGPFAPSTRSRARMRPALRSVIWFCSAAGISTSHVELEQLRVRDCVGAREALQEAVLLHPGVDLREVEAARIVDAALHVGDRDHARAAAAARRAAFAPTLP